MAIEYAVYQPIKEKSLYESFLEGRQLALKRQQMKMQQDMAMDEYVASIIRDPNFTKDSPYNPYINDQLQQTLNEARLKYQTGELNAATFKSYVANRVGKINLWVQNADQIMKTIDEGVNYYKSKGADVTSIKNRAARNIFMKGDGTWRTGDEINQMMQNNEFANAVNNVVANDPELAFKDVKAIDDWMNSKKTSRENISRQTGTIAGGKTGRAGSTISVKGVADYYPVWQEVERNPAGIPVGVRPKTVSVDELKANDAVWMSATAAVKRQKLNQGLADKDGKVSITDQEVANWVTNYANQSRPFNFTKDEEKQQTNIIYRQTDGGESGAADYNIFNATLKGKLPSERFFQGSGEVVSMQPGFVNKLKLGEIPGFGGTSVPFYAKNVVLDKKNKTLTVTTPDNKTATYVAGTNEYSSFMTQLDMNNSWLQGAGSSQPELNPKRSGFKTGF